MLSDLTIKQLLCRLTQGDFSSVTYLQSLSLSHRFRRSHLTASIMCNPSSAAPFLAPPRFPNPFPIAQAPCTNGWFGPNCQYQCHCAESGTCDKHDGFCSSGCHQDWFGPACQYGKALITWFAFRKSTWHQ